MTFLHFYIHYLILKCNYLEKKIIFQVFTFYFCFVYDSKMEFKVQNCDFIFDRKFFISSFPHHNCDPSNCEQLIELFSTIYYDIVKFWPVNKFIFSPQCCIYISLRCTYYSVITHCPILFFTIFVFIFVIYPQAS